MVNFCGAYHDKGSLVVNSATVSLPPICLKTGVNTTNTYRLEDRYIPKSTRIWTFALGGALGYSLAKKKWGQPITLILPLSNSWMQKAAHKSRMSWAGVAIGAGCLVFGLMLSVLHGIFAILGLFGMIVALITAYWRGRSVDAPFRVSYIRDGWYWVDGVKPEVIARFPRLPSQSQ